MPRKGHKMSEEAKRKISIANSGKKPSKEARYKMSEAKRGSHRTEETKNKISLAHKGNKNNNWKGGLYVHCGYIMIYMPNHPYKTSSGYVREHRLVMEVMLGRYLKPEEMPHHINGDRSDNRSENLILCRNKKEHSRYHQKRGVI